MCLPSLAGYWGTLKRQNTRANMELLRAERETSYPARLSNDAIRFILDELSTSDEDVERVQNIITRLQYEIKLREGHGNA